MRSPWGNHYLVPLCGSRLQDRSFDNVDNHFVFSLSSVCGGFSLLERSICETMTFFTNQCVKLLFAAQGLGANESIKLFFIPSMAPEVFAVRYQSYKEALKFDLWAWCPQTLSHAEYPTYDWIIAQINNWLWYVDLFEETLNFNHVKTRWFGKYGNFGAI